MQNHSIIMKLCVLGLLMLLSQSAYAEGKSCGVHKLDKKVAKMQQHLELSDEQAEAIHKIYSSKFEMKACADVESFTERKACRMQQRDTVNAQIMAILNEVQQVNYTNYRENNKKSYKNKGRRGPS